MNIICEPFSRQSRGFGFITFKGVDAAQAAVQRFDKTDLMGRTINVQISKRGRPRGKTPGRYLGNAKASVQYGDRDRKWPKQRRRSAPPQRLPRSGPRAPLRPRQRQR